MSTPPQGDTSGSFDLQPDPRVLPMLGEINIDQWRCIAELVDNSIDGFLHGARSGSPIDAPRVDVILPTADKDGAQLKVTDTGAGMTPVVLETAVRAGWSGNNPIDNLGLFGMGFNIATARLGSITEVWTTRKGDTEWHGLTIDFDELRRQRHFRTAHLRRPKADATMHGTEITIKQLKPEQRRWLAKGANQSAVRKRLAQAYSSMLRKSGEPISFELFINNKRVEPIRHCTWDEKRTVTLPDIGTVSAVMAIKHDLPDKPYCTHCMTWVAEHEPRTNCPVCSNPTLIKRPRRVFGWIGLQRFKDQNEFGIDFIRNGRKIEIANKDLFIWRDSEGEEREYPIDDQRNEGRFVGEIHIDHCRVSYAKDRFDRADQSWEEMLLLLRGEGPLRPEKAKEKGYGPNYSPLFKLFKAFRRTSPHGKAAGGYARLVIVKDNARAKEMALQFNEGIPDYQDDSKWWELVEEADRELLYGSGPKPSSGGPSGPIGGGGLPKGLIDDPPGRDSAGSPSTSGGTSIGSPTSAPTPPTPSPIPPMRSSVPSLSRTYVHAPSSAKFNVKAFEAKTDDPELPNGIAWAMPLADVATRQYHFLFDPTHEVFSSITMTPRDALLAELTWMTAETLRTTRDTPSLADILAHYRQSYGDENLLDLQTMPGTAASILTDIGGAIVEQCPVEDRATLFNNLPLEAQQSVMRALASKKIPPTTVTADGTFLRYAPPEVTRSIIEQHPEYCFDGAIWDEAYESLDYGDKELTTQVRQGVIARRLGLMSDAIWLARCDTNELENASRDELIRATMSLRLLRPDADEQPL